MRERSWHVQCICMSSRSSYCKISSPTIFCRAVSPSVSFATSGCCCLACCYQLMSCCNMLCAPWPQLTECMATIAAISVTAALCALHGSSVLRAIHARACGQHVPQLPRFYPRPFSDICTNQRTLRCNVSQHRRNRMHIQQSCTRIRPLTSPFLPPRPAPGPPAGGCGGPGHLPATAGRGGHAIIPLHAPSSPATCRAAL